MLNNPSFVQSVLTDVMLREATCVEAKRLLLALGAKQDRASAWGRLLDAWEDGLDNPRDNLFGVQIGPTIILARAGGDNNRVLDNVKVWAGE